MDTIVKKRMFITAAITGAVPKLHLPNDTVYLSNLELHKLNNQDSTRLLECIKDEGWQLEKAGGMTFGGPEVAPKKIAKLTISNLSSDEVCELIGDQFKSYTQDNISVIKKEFLAYVVISGAADDLITTLTSQGWIVDDEGNLKWLYRKKSGYIPPSLVQRLFRSKRLIKNLEDIGWKLCDSGYFNPMVARSPYLPIVPQMIASEAILALEHGAAVVHLHTRNVAGGRLVTVEQLGFRITIIDQDNQPELNQYKKIIPQIHGQQPHALVNLSTSVRGNTADSESVHRWNILHDYQKVTRWQGIASLSTGDVLFANKTGYKNSKDFINKQLQRFRELGYTPEIEVFNNEILQNAISCYRSQINNSISNPLFMLVACVDQLRYDPYTKTYSDDSLVSPYARDVCIQIVREGKNTKEAVQCLTSSLQPVVNKIRSHFPKALISLLLPGVLQHLIVDTAVALEVDGIRVGLEDSLIVARRNSRWSRVKAMGSFQQVESVADELNRRGHELWTPQQLREVLMSGNFEHS
ncbi:3-keto-5-aminohexanoate cleavage protein [Pseudomonas sp. P129]|uniref:3-keto-5-aminohexanoate cleavage protein n=1 Tax=Pseudomonas sp. P129 TaxID=2823887 RepID=UPI001CE2476B|nr:3-keto-5-aminohexanoate cleavage protein [Pseudomonas sp. P129]MCA5967990.1 3-keto-5-aminohexanoate cleavage protein [Pseudomonas sp. P129]